MLAFLKKVILDNEFQNNYTFETNTNTGFYYKQNQEYFVVSEYDKKDITEFFQSKRTSNIVGFLDNFKKEHPEFEWIDKDTSLIILLKVSNLEKDFESLKNQIMKIEEDEYFFRKYIIVYDEAWEKEMKYIDTIEKLNTELRWINLKQFRENNFTNSKWYLIIQLFIKLPFLEVVTPSEKLEKLSDIINKRVKSENLVQLNNSILSHESLVLENKKENEGTQKYIQELNDIFLWDDDQKVEDFLNVFTK